MSRTTNHPETVSTTPNDINSELEEHCHRAIQDLLQENDALFKKHEPSSISLAVRRDNERNLFVRATASVRITVIGQSRPHDPKRWDEETKFDQH